MRKGQSGILGAALVSITNSHAQLVINEIDYDQPGTDSAEFIEIKNVTAGRVSLKGYSVQLVNSSTTVPAVYRTILLPATQPARPTG